MKWTAAAWALVIVLTSGVSWSSNLLGRSDGGEVAAFILEETRVYTEIAGNVAQTEVVQVYTNPFDAPIEGIYFFPLPETSAINRMVMMVGDRVVEAEIKLREEAQEIYEEAKDEGKRAALLEEKRDNIFKQSVANIMPGDRISIYLRFVQPVLYEDDMYTYRFPTVVGPRYFPEGTDPAATEVQPAYSDPAVEKSKHAFKMDVVIRSGVEIESIESPSHGIDVEKDVVDGIHEIAVSNRDGDVPDRDFVLRYRLEGDAIGTSLLAHRTDEEGYFMLVLHPPLLPDKGKIAPKEMIFVLDASGSMSGTPIEIAKSLMKAAVENMNVTDTFQILSFSNDVQKFFDRPVESTPANVKKAVETIDAIASSGGTEMLRPFEVALDGQPPDGRLRMIFFLTDGYVGNEKEILDLVRSKNSAARVFPVGIGSAPNTYLIESLAGVGRGAPFYFAASESEDEVVKRFYGKISSPYLVDIEVKAKGVKIGDVNPEYVPDLFAGTPLYVVGRYEDGGKGQILVKGRIGAKTITIPVEAIFPEESEANSAVKYLWADRRIKEMEGREDFLGEDNRLEIEKLALAYHLVSRYTSFVAVEKEIANTTGLDLTKVLAKVHIPEGTKWEGFFGEGTVIGASLTPDRIQPGDPEIVVRGEGVAAVTSVLPWGETVEHAYDPARDEYVGRFLVPDSVPDGVYRVGVHVRLRGGDTKVLGAWYRVDMEPPTFDLDAEMKDGKLHVKAVPGPDAFEGKLIARKGGIEVRARVDVKRVEISIGAAVYTPTYLEKEGYWEVTCPVPDGWSGTIKLSAVDYADNATVLLETMDFK